MALISKNTPFRTLNERRFSYLLKRSQLKQVASSGRYTLKQKTRGVSGEDSLLERCGLRTGGERIVLGEDNIPTEEQRRGETLARSARGGSPSLSARRMSSDQSEQGRSQLLPPRLRLLSLLPRPAAISTITTHEQRPRPSLPLFSSLSSARTDAEATFPEASKRVCPCPRDRRCYWPQRLNFGLTRWSL